MKNLTLIVHTDIEQVLADMLRGLKQVSGFTFTHVDGHSAHDKRDPAFSARDRVVGYTPHVRVDILLEGRDVDDILQALRTSDCGLAGRGIYWILPVEQHGQL